MRPSVPSYPFRRIVVGGFFGLLALMGLSVLIFAVYDYKTAMVAKTWPQAEAIVLRDGTEGLTQAIDTEYVYSQDGHNFHGRQVRFFINNRLLNPARPLIFKAGDSFPVFVYPNDPSRAIIVPGASGIGFMALFMLGVVIFFIGLGCCIRACTYSANHLTA